MNSWKEYKRSLFWVEQKEFLKRMNSESNERTNEDKLEEGNTVSEEVKKII